MHPLASYRRRARPGADAADKWIADRIGPGDVCVTADVPLAARCVEAGARAIAPDGGAFTSASIGARLAMRDLMADLRASDPFRPGRRPAVRAPPTGARFLKGVWRLAAAGTPLRARLIGPALSAA